MWPDRLRLRLGALLVVCILGAACQFNPWADEFAKGVTDENVLVGTYRIDADSLHRKIEVEDAVQKMQVLELRSDMELTLNADHSAHFVKVPDEMTKDAASYGFCELSGKGTWKLYGDNFSTVDVSPDLTTSPSCNGPVSFHLFGSNPPYKLHITIGDPDLGQAIQFEKIR
jgi:hypothetical protein